jgi:hypothetical protein
MTCALFICLTLLAVSCGSTDSTRTTSEASGSSAAIDVFSATKEVGPKITDSKFPGKTTWSSGNTLYTIYTLIKDYVNNGDTMGQGVDGSNMYVAMSSAQNGVERVLESCDAITSQTISTVFNFEGDTINSGINYNCIHNASETENGSDYVYSYALNEDGVDYYMNMGWYVDEGTQDTPQSLELHWNDTAKTIALNSAYLVSYDTGSTYNVRMNLRGDVDTHLFTLKLMKSGYMSGTTRGYTISIVGHGLSEGGYYLFKVSTGSGGGPLNAAKYFCIPSNATDTYLQSMDDDGHANSDAAITVNCGDYVAIVDAESMFDVTDATTSDAADSKTEFVGAGTSGGEQWVKLSTI